MVVGYGGASGFLSGGFDSDVQRRTERPAANKRRMCLRDDRHLQPVAALPLNFRENAPTTEEAGRARQTPCTWWS